jgi:uncharacterized protein (TIGR03000 family)
LGFGYPYYRYGYGYSPWWYGYPGYYGYGYDNGPGYYSYQPAYPVPDTGTEAAQPGDAMRVTAIVKLPSPDAQVWVEGQEMGSGGTRRLFTSPPLDEGRYTYHFEARWQENGRTMDAKREVPVQAGDHITVDFTRTVR